MAVQLGKRIMIIGSGGSGKSTLARQLGDITGLPVIHLDKYYWQADWVSTPQDRWTEKQKQLIAGDQWIVDGNYGNSLDLRLQRADTIVFLDFRRTVCLYRAIKRWLCHIGETRPDMADGCPERIDREFIRWIWTFPSAVRPEILDKIAAYPHIPCLVLKNRRQVADFLKNLTASFP